MPSAVLRTIQQRDNAPLAAIIRQTLISFQANVPGTAFSDPELNALFETFQTPGAWYWIAGERNNIL
ncbi:hypothetical protein [Chitinophaga tropicalis]|uniref:Acetyltransferase n=1 Tax=Chitinophaga tropicalis TaxID=2683588 RepID=A0A7K1TYI7_9BACT|nr:hypothetical protein [Chitinophaga tropicalis]MVT07152.1 hypothetical protein [Chitinophaga tropicalis]